jgi:pescadillo protein
LVEVSQIVKRSFISVKGIYMNIEIMGQDITWLVPINSPQNLSFDVDYDIMLTFIELYANLLKFVNYKLYKDIGMAYPPPLENVDFDSFGFTSQQIHSLQQSCNNKKSKINDESESNANDFIQSAELDLIKQKENRESTRKQLFSKFIFFISREVPKETFKIIISSCGGLYGDESEFSSFDQNDERITHYIVDRPAELIDFKGNKEYVQPQWIIDCLNNNQLLPTSIYFPGKRLPAHVSPFYDQEIEGQEKNNKIDKEEAEQLELQEMMLSKKKQKKLAKIRVEKAETKRKVKKI